MTPYNKYNLYEYGLGPVARTSAFQADSPGSNYKNLEILDFQTLSENPGGRIFYFFLNQKNLDRINKKRISPILTEF